MGYLSFPENLLIIPGLAPNVGAGAAQTSIPISLKNVQKLWAVCYIRPAALDLCTTNRRIGRFRLCCGTARYFARRADMV